MLVAGTVKEINPIFIAGLGGTIGGIILLAAIQFSKNPITKIQLRKNKKDLLQMTFFRTMLGQTMLLVGLSLTLPIKAIFFTKIEPYFVLLWERVKLKEKIHRKHLALLGMHIFGAFMLSTGLELTSFGTTHIGDLLIILSMFVMSFTYIVGKRLSHSFGSIKTTAITTFVGSFIVLTAVLMMLPLSVPANFSVSYLPWLYFGLYVVMWYPISLPLWYSSLKFVRGWIVSALRIVGPIVGAAVAFFLFGNTLNEIQIIGVVIVLITSFLIVREHQKDAESPHSARKKYRKTRHHI